MIKILKRTDEEDVLIETNIENPMRILEKYLNTVQYPGYAARMVRDMTETSYHDGVLWQTVNYRVETPKIIKLGDK